MSKKGVSLFGMVVASLAVISCSAGVDPQPTVAAVVTGDTVLSGSVEIPAIAAASISPNLSSLQGIAVASSPKRLALANVAVGSDTTVEILGSTGRLLATTATDAAGNYSVSVNRSDLTSANNSDNATFYIRSTTSGSAGVDISMASGVTVDLDSLSDSTSNLNVNSQSTLAVELALKGSGTNIQTTGGGGTPIVDDKDVDLSNQAISKAVENASTGGRDAATDLGKALTAMAMAMGSVPSEVITDYVNGDADAIAEVKAAVVEGGALSALTATDVDAAQTALDAVRVAVNNLRGAVGVGTTGARKIFGAIFLNSSSDVRAALSTSALAQVVADIAGAGSLEGGFLKDFLIPALIIESAESPTIVAAAVKEAVKIGSGNYGVSKSMAQMLTNKAKNGDLPFLTDLTSLVDGQAVVMFKMFGAFDLLAAGGGLKDFIDGKEKIDFDVLADAVYHEKGEITAINMITLGGQVKKYLDLGSCKNRCTDFQFIPTATCQCDFVCSDAGDCCSDVAAECGFKKKSDYFEKPFIAAGKNVADFLGVGWGSTFSPDLTLSCAGECGGMVENGAGDGCSCFAECQLYGTCCPDFKAACPDEAKDAFTNLSTTLGGWGANLGAMKSACQPNEAGVETMDIPKAMFELGLPWQYMECIETGVASGSLNECFTFPEAQALCNLPSPKYGSCEDVCGGSVAMSEGSMTKCFCDTVCQEAGDCCDDKITLCGDSSNCGASAEGGVVCNDGITLDPGKIFIMNGGMATGVDAGYFTSKPGLFSGSGGGFFGGGGVPGSCAGSCGFASSPDAAGNVCFCDSACVNAGDCCADYANECSGGGGTPPPPPPDGGGNTPQYILEIASIDPAVVIGALTEYRLLCNDGTLFDINAATSFGSLFEANITGERILSFDNPAGDGKRACSLVAYLNGFANVPHDAVFQLDAGGTFFFTDKEITFNNRGTLIPAGGGGIFRMILAFEEGLVVPPNDPRVFTAKCRQQGVPPNPPPLPFWEDTITLTEDVAPNGNITFQTPLQDFPEGNINCWANDLAHGRYFVSQPDLLPVQNFNNPLDLVNGNKELTGSVSNVYSIPVTLPGSQALENAGIASVALWCNAEGTEDLVTDPAVPSDGIAQTIINFPFPPAPPNQNQPLECRGVGRDLNDQPTGWEWHKEGGVTVLIDPTDPARSNDFVYDPGIGVFAESTSLTNIVNVNP